MADVSWASQRPHHARTSSASHAAEADHCYVGTPDVRFTRDKDRHSNRKSYITPKQCKSSRKFHTPRSLQLKLADIYEGIGVVDNFPNKLKKLVDSPDYSSIVWDQEGKGVVITEVEFRDEVLNETCHVFETTSFKSFVRQLNLYGFRKNVPGCDRSNSKEVHTFYHRWFTRDNTVLSMVVRRKNTKTSPQDNSFVSIDTPSSRSFHREQEVSPEYENDQPTPIYREDMCLPSMSRHYLPIWSPVADRFHRYSAATSTGKPRNTKRTPLGRLDTNAWVSQYANQPPCLPPRRLSKSAALLQSWSCGEADRDGRLADKLYFNSLSADAKPDFHWPSNVFSFEVGRKGDVEDVYSTSFLSNDSDVNQANVAFALASDESLLSETSFLNSSGEISPCYQQPHPLPGADYVIPATLGDPESIVREVLVTLPMPEVTDDQDRAHAWLVSKARETLEEMADAL
ncbi:HSFX2 [Branchiostoma lanceolatum]|uniref:HSFX2 protein n=1 Tax=Branchiostoma lanceolatum TaxID=7740 RepID=A0A8J9ZR74_BRALA|nr:HSFX2 [Branchiostoma lanceolatum]